MAQNRKIEAIFSKVLQNIKKVRNPYCVEFPDLLSNMVLQYHKFFLPLSQLLRPIFKYRALGQVTLLFRLGFYEAL